MLFLLTYLFFGMGLIPSPSLLTIVTVWYNTLRRGSSYNFLCLISIHQFQRGCSFYLILSCFAWFCCITVFILLTTIVTVCNWVTPDIFGIAPRSLQISVIGVCTLGGNCNELTVVYISFVASTLVETGTVVFPTRIVHRFEGAVASLYAMAS